MSRKIRNSAPAVVSPVVAVNVGVSPISVNLDDAARLVGAPAFSVREAIGNGSLTAKKIGRHYVIRVADLQRWIDSLDSASQIPCFVRRQEAREAGVR